MKRKIEIEDLLAKYNLSPGGHIKRRILDYYDEMLGRKEVHWKLSRFWTITVPLYAAAFVILVVAGFSFYAGFSFMQRDKQFEQVIESSYERSENFSCEVSWYIAKADLL